ncbi:two-component system response regulator [Leptolyngbya sp. 'hensonii']|uniref:response regulator n=1 Tax=Leptolyngbya sp. 'hensonii' TaxID=1922337 RepID=UPI00094FA6AE|nr:response regulator [Leptolyngbya sp. 'hensonii']OLP19957.1 two-component system response regulator [Leptolyngbya sp. 'hensonii']
MATHKILVIDDSKVIRSRVRDMLPKGNFEVLEAKDGLEGLNLVRQERPNLIMLDFLLPRMSGWEVYQHIEEEHELRLIPLVVMSGRKEEVTEKISEPFEFFEFIEKPFEQKQLVEAIKSAMIKIKRKPPLVTSRSSVPDGYASSTENSADIQALQEKIIAMQQEIDQLKKQMTQIITIIKQKLK